MMKKLIKYDLKSMLRVFIPLWLLAPIISLLFSFSIRASIKRTDESGFLGLYEYGGDIFLAVMSLLFTVVVITLLVLSTVLVIQRFWNGLLKDEGYLMFTLPVEPWQLITAKGLTATFVCCVSGLMGILSFVILLLGSSDEIILGFLEAWNYFWDYIYVEIGAAFWIVLVEGIILLVLGTVKSIYQLYAAMSIGQLANTHRVLAAFVAYVGISTVLSIIGSIAMVVVVQVVPDDWMYWLNADADQFLMLYLLFLILVTVAQIAIFHVISERILSTRLNLE